VVKADLILDNANVITMEKEGHRTNIVAIKGNRILFTGSRESINSFLANDTKIVDCHNKTVIPGFIDAHCHIFSLLRKLVGLDFSLSNIKSISDIQTIISEQTKILPPGSWIEGTGYNEFYLKEKRHPTRWDLDEAAPNNPVVIAHRSLHSCVLNSLALNIAGFNKDFKEIKGILIERDPITGEPNGRLYEMLGYIREKVMPPLTESDIDYGSKKADELLISSGITSINDASITNNYERWKIIRRTKDRGLIHTRISMTAGTETFQSFRNKRFVYNSGDLDLRFLGFKIILNEATGEVYPPQLELNQIVFEKQNSGLPVLIHAVTREMVESAINAYEFTNGKLPGLNIIQRIEHCSECPDPILNRLKNIKPIIVTQPIFVYYNGDRYLKIIAENKISSLYRFRSLWNAGLTLAAGSDFPVVPHQPLLGIYAAVTRATEQNQYLLPDEIITPYQAMMMYTINAAIASGEESIKGSISTGKLADIVILSDNPLTIKPEKIKNLTVDMTIIGGKILWLRN
jgi:predicted amidohydrolase YtcJ